MIDTDAIGLGKGIKERDIVGTSRHRRTVAALAKGIFRSRVA
jgi:hypothetical protein